MELIKKTLSEQIYEILKSDIISHRISFGERLTNRDLQKKFSVSSTPVRDAINHLYLDGLVENITNSGAKVITFDLQFALEVNEMVSVMCCAALELSSLRNKPAEICKKLESFINKQKTAASGDDYIMFDYLFHKSFFDYCGNAQLLMSYERYHVLLEMLVRHFHDFQDNHLETINQHQCIFDAYCSSNITEASELMKKHFFLAEELFKKFME